jgi:hypothetical protein
MRPLLKDSIGEADSALAATKVLAAASAASRNTSMLLFHHIAAIEHTARVEIPADGRNSRVQGAQNSTSVIKSDSYSRRLFILIQGNYSLLCGPLCQIICQVTAAGAGKVPEIQGSRRHTDGTQRCAIKYPVFATTH